MPLNMAQIQRDDSSLAALFLKAKEPQKSNHRGSADEFVLQKNILYRQQGAFRQLVVPRDARGMVLTLGHSIPWAGHLGTRKTLARIKRHFYWPGLRTEVAQFCRTCSQCQLTSNKFPSRAPLQPLPLIDMPFERLGMDIVGPLERSKSGHRYMLVITDYATKYPEVFPLKTIKARAVAVSLVQHFSRVGFPCEIVTDQGTNFMSALLKQVYQLLGIKGVRTTPYHPQTDGLTERFNQTLKQMLRKFVDETGPNWDQWLPYLLFAYREVPQPSTGFSPFELLYGHEVRGPLALLKETWAGEEGREEPVNVISYVMQMRERLQKMTALAQQHMAEAQK
uniref:Gypsy retrotransposon integrase-like protein 1 n=1 Tax=Xiphophorus maculatus TaxID=8083 RepID=A0A3B5RCM4_XIPMA